MKLHAMKDPLPLLHCHRDDVEPEHFVHLPNLIEISICRVQLLDEKITSSAKAGGKPNQINQTGFEPVREVLGPRAVVISLEDGDVLLATVLAI